MIKPEVKKKILKDIKKGDYLIDIADKYNVSLEYVRRCRCDANIPSMKNKRSRKTTKILNLLKKGYSKQYICDKYNYSLINITRIQYSYNSEIDDHNAEMMFKKMIKNKSFKECLYTCRVSNQFLIKNNYIEKILNSKESKILLTRMKKSTYELLSYQHLNMPLEKICKEYNITMGQIRHAYYFYNCKVPLTYKQLNFIIKVMTIQMALETCRNLSDAEICKNLLMPISTFNKHKIISNNDKKLYSDTIIKYSKYLNIDDNLKEYLNIKEED